MPCKGIPGDTNSGHSCYDYHTPVWKSLDLRQTGSRTWSMPVAGSARRRYKQDNDCTSVVSPVVFPGVWAVCAMQPLPTERTQQASGEGTRIVWVYSRCISVYHIHSTPQCAKGSHLVSWILPNQVRTTSLHMYGLFSAALLAPASCTLLSRTHQLCRDKRESKHTKANSPPPPPPPPGGYLTLATPMIPLFAVI